MIESLRLFSLSFESLTNLYAMTRSDSTQRFIELMRQRYGPEEKAGRGNVLNFGGQITFAIGNSKRHSNGYFYAIQPDFLNARFKKHTKPPLGIFAALICGDESIVLVIPHSIMAEAMKNSPTKRFNIVPRGQSYYLRVSGSPLFEITEYLNNYPESVTKAENADEPSKDTIEPVEQQQTEIHEHTRIQWMLIRFGLAADCSVWVPASDRGKEFDSEKFSDLTLPELPNFGFDAITGQVIANIDVLWLEGNVIHKAFEVESTTSIYSGLLRMSDLVLSQPNISIDLHIVAPLRRREIVRRNILRPTFARLRPKCSYISFEEVTSKFNMVRDILKRQQARIRDLLESEKF